MHPDEEEETEFETAEQFWLGTSSLTSPSDSSANQRSSIETELERTIAISPRSNAAELDDALRNYIILTSEYLADYLQTSAQLDQALIKLLNSKLFTVNSERMIQQLISCISQHSNHATLFIALKLILSLGLSNPLVSSKSTGRQRSTSRTPSPVFVLMRKRFVEVVPMLMRCVTEVERDETRLGTAATSVLFEICRVQRLNSIELGVFSPSFIAHLFSLVERTRDAEDETFNYSLIRLLIALNEQYMVSILPPPSPHHNHRGLPPPILPTMVGHAKQEMEGNLVLEVLKRTAGENKTFGENIIFILNRSNGSPDSLCVSLLILKILYLLFTTTETQEYIYTNDLCVLVDVFIRELCDLGDESEGLKHTYLRVLHPLLTNTQLRDHPYKRLQLHRVLTGLISPSRYREVDATTRRLTERCLKGGWCEGMEVASEKSGLQERLLKVDSSLSVNVIAQAEDVGMGPRRQRRPSNDSYLIVPTLSSSTTLPAARASTDSSSVESSSSTSHRRRRAPPPPSPSPSRPTTPFSTTFKTTAATFLPSPSPVSTRRAAPLAPPAHAMRRTVSDHGVRLEKVTNGVERLQV